jgi:hypothetical protein
MGRSRSGRLTCSVACRVALSRRKSKPEAHGQSAGPRQ